MEFYEILILSAALAVDAMLVSFSYGLVLDRNRLKTAAELSASFGFFQGFMPVFGYFSASIVYEYIKNYSKWAVFIVFFLLALKFIKDSFEKDNDDKCGGIDGVTLKCALLTGAAVSIDALGAGVSLRFLNSGIFKPSLIIGIVTFIISAAGFAAGRIFSHADKRYMLLTGAALLLYTAVKQVI